MFIVGLIVGFVVGSVATWLVSKTEWGNKFFVHAEKEIREEIEKVKTKK